MVEQIIDAVVAITIGLIALLGSHIICNIMSLLLDKDNEDGHNEN